MTTINKKHNGKKVLMIDNYDSFTWNIYQYLCQLGADVTVYRNDQVSVEDCIKMNPTHLVISPGPGHPRSAGVSSAVMKAFEGKIPIYGVCLGEQCMFELYGGTVTYAGEIMHGKTSHINHDGKWCFKGIPQRTEVIRYHSLAGDPKTLPDVLEVTSETDSKIIMGVRHKVFAIEGVQFHPESIKTTDGMKMLDNFLSLSSGYWKDNHLD